MAPIEWKADFAIGIAAVDHEHRALIALVNKLQAALVAQNDIAQIEEGFGDLFRDIAAHFALEERFMRDHRYDAYAPHKADHERLLDILRAMMDDAHDDASGAIPTDGSHLLESHHRFTNSVVHFSQTDGSIRLERTTSAPADRLADALEAWFSVHFKTHDARLHARLGAPPRQA
ncbi:MAG: bacteriohemerythrin [Pseudomonadota bacterium]